ncbi:MAG: presenilin family intramembrane aspartyl protease [Candidatus Hodarchaeales archaeon]|jgi:MFS family permease
MSENSINNQKSKLKAFFFPIMIVIVIAIALSGLTLDFYANPLTPDVPDDLSPIPENPEDPGGIAFGAILNMLYYVIFIFIAGFITLLIYKKGFMHFLTYFFAVAMGISWFSFGVFYGWIFSVHILGFLNSILDYIPEIIHSFFVFIFEGNFVVFSEVFYVYDIMLLLFGVFLGFLGTYSFVRQSFDKLWLRNSMMVVFGPMIGSMLAIHFGLLTVFFILIGLSLYDIYAVFYGPLKGIIDQSREDSKEIEEKIERQEIDVNEVTTGPLMPALPVYSTPLINIGLGDFAFFSMLVSAAVVVSYGLSTPIPLLMAVIGLLVGAYYTFQFLKEDRALPGLPLPIFGGLSTMLIGVIIVMIIDGVSLEAVFGLF